MRFMSRECEYCQKSCRPVVTAFLPVGDVVNETRARTFWSDVPRQLNFTENRGGMVFAAGVGLDN